MRLTARARLAALAGLALALLAPALRADELESLTLRYRSAEDVIPLLQPLLPAGAAVSGAGDVLLVRGSAAAIAQVREALAVLDRAPRQLLITVGQSTDARGSRTGVHGSATIGSGDAQVGINRPPGPEPGVSATLHQRTARDDLRNVSSVRTLEGRECYVSMGTSRPFTSTTVVAGAYGPVVSGTTEYRDVQSGFYATPRVQGDRVTIELSPTQQAAGPSRDAAIATRSLTTTVTGRLGEWIPLGGARESDDGGTSGVATLSTRSDSTQYTAWVKVEEVPSTPAPAP